LLSGKQGHVRDFTASHEHYLRGILEVREHRGYARLSDVARELGVAPSTLSVGLKPLEARGLLTHDDQRFLILTPAGERIAREVHHRFAVLRTFLQDVLGIPKDRALTEACLLEHDMSGKTADRLLDLVKMLRDDAEVREVFKRRFASYERHCSPADQCSTCDLSCPAFTSLEGP